MTKPVVFRPDRPDDFWESEEWNYRFHGMMYVLTSLLCLVLLIRTVTILPYCGLYGILFIPVVYAIYLLLVYSVVNSIVKFASMREVRRFRREIMIEKILQE